MLLTVVICTYRRDELLAISLQTLNEQTLDRSAYRVVVVDNAGLATTRGVAERFGVDYITEPQLGLSHARNCGASTCTTPWILYLDDDIRAPADLLEKFVRRIETQDCAALGGIARHWFRTTPPVWLRRYYAEPIRPSRQTEFGTLPDEHYLIGCPFAVRKGAWQQVGGFSPEVGMKGHTVGRGEEDEFQLRMRRAGLRICFDPEIYLDHLVQPYKYTMRGIMQLAYASGRDGVGMRGNEPLTGWGFIKRAAVITCYSLPFNLARLVFKRGYYWQNAMVDTLTKYYFAVAQLRANKSTPS